MSTANTKLADDQAIDTSTEEQEKLDAIRSVIDTYKDKEGCLITVLHLTQEIYGFLPLEIQRIVADGMGVSLSYVTKHACGSSEVE